MNRPAGGSARAEYERQRERRRIRLRQRWWAVAAGALIAFGFGYVVVAPIPGAVFAAFDSVAPGVADNAPNTPVGLAVGSGLVFAVVGAWSLTRPSMTESAWRKGAAGEVIVGRRLKALAEEGLSVIHDVRLPGSRANIDHLVVSPHGVFTVETKAYRGRLTVRRRGKALWINGRDRSHMLDQARHQAEAVRSRLAGGGLGHVPVTPVLCFVGTQVPWFIRNNAGGVELTTVRRLRRILLSDDAPAVKPGDTEAVVQLLEGQPARVDEHREKVRLDAGRDETTLLCSRCGKPMVRRTRRKDGVPFYGCSGFPSCRYTRPID